MGVETRTTSSTGGQKGVKLARFDLIPAGPLKELAEHYGKGARKYANHQWRNGYEWSKSIGAIGRHFNDFMAGKDYDTCWNEPENCAIQIEDGTVVPYNYNKATWYLEDNQPVAVEIEGQRFRLSEPRLEPGTCFNHTGSHHMVAVAWHSFLLLEFKDTHPEHDDRWKPSKEEYDALLDRIDPDHNAVALVSPV